MRLPRRRTFWLSAGLLLAVAIGGIWLLAPRSRITQAKLDPIQVGMGLSEVVHILGKSYRGSRVAATAPQIMDGRAESCGFIQSLEWNDGPNSITVELSAHGEVMGKTMYLDTAAE